MTNDDGDVLLLNCLPVFLIRTISKSLDWIELQRRYCY